MTINNYTIINSVSKTLKKLVSKLNIQTHTNIIVKSISLRSEFKNSTLSTL